jgi:hypothetical protein
VTHIVYDGTMMTISGNEDYIFVYFVFSCFLVFRTFCVFRFVIPSLFFLFSFRVCFSLFFLLLCVQICHVLFMCLLLCNLPYALPPSAT